MLDFDGTLAPITADPSPARISSSARRALEACIRRLPIAVISGRALSDVRKRVGIHSVWYVGNHGLEWSLGPSRGRAKISRKNEDELRTASRGLRVVAKRYPGTFVEDKRLSLSLHFRHIPPSQIVRLRREMRTVLAPLSRYIESKEGQEYVFNVRPKGGPHKGNAVRMIRAKFPLRALPIFIGDDATDEDAFHALKKGVTIRVGKRAGSAARYYVRTRADVDRFLSILAGLHKRKSRAT